uniref:Post-GPI attachment to proteins factor 3 n=1 Tax=Panagrellus redivivus TaxID=6233 RepID=A0A7E4UVJ2_PANRE
MIIFLALLSVLLPVAYGSQGDSFAFFQDCATFCRRDHDCPEFKFGYAWTTSPCFQCRQNCVFETVRTFEAYGWPIPQFFGKWPFASIAFDIGPLPIVIQEPASVVFSLLNLWAVTVLHQKINDDIDDDYRLKGVWLNYARIGYLVWIASAVFHARDFWLTEYLDYFAACGVVFYAFFAAVSFTLPVLQSNIKAIKIWLTFAALLLGTYLFHVASLLLSMDYGHNMTLCIGLSIITAVIYTLWAVREILQGRNRPSITILFKILGVGLGAALFEVLDFPPIFWTFDAHSLFHAATIPTPLLLAQFAIAEADYEAKAKKHHAI